ncbi:MAG: urease accessory protein UreD [Mesorhizobium sp.]|nr:urease accessory protein UreD [Mesorhizobium sp.]
MKLERIDHPLATQRVKGEGRLAVGLVEGRTRIRELYQQGAAKIRLPEKTTGPLEAVLINTAGGMTGGDRLDWTFSIGAGSAAVFTTQACEKIYRSSHGGAEVRTRISVGSGGRLAWLPQETILYDRSVLDRRLDIDLDADATALIAEATLFGRRSMGETVVSSRYRDAWRVRRGGRLVHAEAIAFTGEVAAKLETAAVAGGATAMATVLLIAPDAEMHLDAVRRLIGAAGAASAWSVSRGNRGGTGKLLARLLAQDGYQLRQRLVPILELLNGRASLPKVWSL